MPLTIGQRVDIVLWYESSKSFTVVQRRFRSEYGIHTQVPDKKTIIKWHTRFHQTGSVQAVKRFLFSEIPFEMRVKSTLAFKTRLQQLAESDGGHIEVRIVDQYSSSHV